MQSSPHSLCHPSLPSPAPFHSSLPSFSSPLIPSLLPLPCLTPPNSQSPVPFSFCSPPSSSPGSSSLAFPPLPPALGFFSHFPLLFPAPPLLCSSLPLPHPPSSLPLLFILPLACLPSLVPVPLPSFLLFLSTLVQVGQDIVKTDCSHRVAQWIAAQMT